MEASLFTVKVRTIYALSMPKTISVQLKGVPNPIQITDVQDVEASGGDWELRRKDGAVLARFDCKETQGWWIFEETK